MYLKIKDNNYYGLENKIKTNKLRGSKGITLIALVVSIVVLLILAGISIQTLTR